MTDAPRIAKRRRVAKTIETGVVSLAPSSGTSPDGAIAKAIVADASDPAAPSQVKAKLRRANGRKRPAPATNQRESPALEQALARLEAERLSTAGMQQLIDESLSRLRGLEARQDELHGSLAEAEARSARARLVENELAQQRVRNSELTQQLTARDGRLAEFEQTAEALRAALAEAEARTAEQASRALELDGELTAERRRLAELTLQSSGLQVALAEERRRSAEFASAARQTEAELEAKAALATAIGEAAQKKMAAELEAQRQDMARLTREAAKAKIEKEKLDGRLKERFDEIATLTRLLKEAEQTREAAASQLDRAVAALLESGGLPFLSGRIARLRRSGLFDGAWYLRRYKDVADAGVDPARHFVQCGMNESRAPNPVFAKAKGETAKEAE